MKYLRDKRPQTLLLKYSFDITGLFSQRHYGCVRDILCQAEGGPQGSYCGRQHLR